MEVTDEGDLFELLLCSVNKNLHLQIIMELSTPNNTYPILDTDKIHH